MDDNGVNVTRYPTNQEFTIEEVNIRILVSNSSFEDFKKDFLKTAVTLIAQVNDLFNRMKSFVNSIVNSSACN